jgi:hypothetical protein
MEKGDVHHNKYDGHYTKQRVRITKVTLTSPILRKRSTCRTSFYKSYLMKHDVNEEMPNQTPNT